MNLFESSAKPVLQSAITTMEARGAQYSDTLASCQWHITLAVAKELGIRITDRQARALAIAGLCDIKHERFAGGYKMDHIEDGINYLAVLPNMVEVAREEPSNIVPLKQPGNEALVAGEPFKDSTFECAEHNTYINGCGCEICRAITEAHTSLENNKRVIRWHTWTTGDVSGFVNHELVYSIKFDETQQSKTGFGYTLSNMRPFCSDKYSFCLLRSAQAFAAGQEEKL